MGLWGNSKKTTTPRPVQWRITGTFEWSGKPINEVVTATSEEDAVLVYAKKHDLWQPTKLPGSGWGESKWGLRNWSGTQARLLKVTRA